MTTDERIEQLEAELAAIKVKLERAEALYLKFMGGAGRRLLKMLGADVSEMSP